MIEVFSSEASCGYEIHEVRHPNCRARIAHCGAQVLEWTPTGFGPMLYRSRRSIPKAGTPTRGGIPICWPWFADHPDSASMPLHGFVQSLRWNHGFTEANDEEIRLGFWLEDDPATRELWPHRFRLEVEMWLGSGLCLQLRMRNTGNSAFSAGGAFHPYFAIGSLAQTTLEGVSGVRYFDKTIAHREAGGRGPLIISNEVDRIYQNTGAVMLHDGALQRRVRIASSGHAATVVWNPGREEAAKVEDMGPEDFNHFVAVEPVLPHELQVLLSPGDQHLLTMEITVSHSFEDSSGTAF